MKKDIKISISEYFQKQELEGMNLISSTPNQQTRKLSRFTKILTSVSLASLLLVGCGTQTDKAQINAQEPKQQNIVEATSNSDYKLIEVWKTVENEKGVMLYDPNAEFEKDIFVSKKDANKWNLSDVEIGQKVVGVFDKDGWELLDVMKIENQSN